MSEYDDAIAFLGQQEGGSIHKTAVLAYVKKITSESSGRGGKIRELENRIVALQTTLGTTEDNVEQVVKALQQQVKDLTKERDDLKTSNEANNTELATLKEEKTKREKADRLQALAKEVGADAEAFSQLLGELTIEKIGDTITVKTKENGVDKTVSLDDYLKAEPAWKRAALFTKPEQEKTDDQQQDQQGITPPGNKQQLPGAPPSDDKSNKNKTTTGSRYMSTRYGGSDRFKQN